MVRDQSKTTRLYCSCSPVRTPISGAPAGAAARPEVDEPVPGGVTTSTTTDVPDPKLRISTGRVSVKPVALAEVSPLDEAELVHLMETIFGSALEARSDGWFSLGVPSPDQVLAFLERSCADPKLVSD